MAELDALTASTRRLIREDPSLIDAVFQADPTLAYARQTLRKDFNGGYRIDEPMIYDGMVGGAYAKGKEFDITEKQIEQNNQFFLKFFEANVTLSLEDIEVLNVGPQQAFSLVKSRMSSAYMSLGAFLSLSMYMNDTRAGFTPMLSGFAQAINDGTTNSWDANAYTTYGTLTRGGSIMQANNANTVVVNGAITYNRLTTSYQAASYGSITPNMGVTTPLGLVYIKNHFQPQQRFETVNPDVGFRGLQFEGASIMTSRYVPGSYLATSAGTNDPVAVGFMTQTSNGALTAYPTLNVASSETLFWINARNPYFNFYVSRAPKFSFGFTGFKWSPGNTKVSGQCLVACAITLSPRYHSQLSGFTS